MAYKIFISYSQKDISVAKTVAALLTEIKYVRVFFAEENLSPGDAIPHSIKKRIRNSDLFVLLWSTNSRKSAWVAQELGLAIAERVRILPIVLTKDFKVPDLLGHVKAVHAFSNRGRAFDEMATHVTRWSTFKMRRDKRESDNYISDSPGPVVFSGTSKEEIGKAVRRAMGLPEKKSLLERFLDKLDQIRKGPR